MSTFWNKLKFLWEDGPSRATVPCKEFVRELQLANNGECACCGHPYEAHNQ